MSQERWAHLRTEVERSGLGPAAIWAVEDDAQVVLAVATVNDPPEQPAGVPLAVDNAVVGFLDLLASAPSAPSAPLSDAATIGRIAVALDHDRAVWAERKASLGAEHARRHVALLRASGVVFGASHDDPEEVLGGVVSIMIPAFADWCAVDVPDGDTVRRLAWDTSPAVDGALVPALLTAYPGWPHAIARTIASGYPALTKVVAEAEGDHDHLAVAAALGLDSVLIVPISLRGLTFGAITCGTVRPRRGFRPSDVAAAGEVASRAAAAVERALLFRETRDRADQASDRAAQLRRLMEAALTVHARHTFEDVLHVAADQARRVMDATAGVALLNETATTPAAHAVAPEGGPEAAMFDRALSLAVRPEAVPSQEFDAITTRAGGWLGAGLTDASGGTIGALVVAGKQDGGAYTADDESLLVSLAHLSSVALETAGLYERAKASEARVRALVEASPLGIVELGAAGDVQETNHAARRLFDWHDPATPRTFPIPELTVLPVMLDHEFVLQVGERALDLSVSTARLPDGSVLVVLADITERKRLEDEVGKTRRMEAVGRMAGGVAHDFNNLLTVVLGHSHLLLRTLGPEDSARSHVDAIKLAGERAANLSAQLLTISKGQMVQPTLVQLNDAITSMSAVLARLLPDEVELALHADPAVGPILADQGQLEQLLLNLVVNARDAMPDGGRLSVSTGMSATGDTVLLTVTDTGEGMTAEVRERCFEPFFSTRRRVSAGLGLATVYGIVTQAGGRITVASQPGAGTTFTIEFPRARGDVAAKPRARRETDARGNEQVLLVEDDVAVRSLTRQMLERDGYAVTEASGFTEALAVANSDARIDLVITDVVMPDVDGVELLGRLEEIRGPLPALFVSGFVDSSADRPEGIPDGAGFLAKPFGPGELAAKVRAVLRGRSAQGSR